MSGAIVLPARLDSAAAPELAAALKAHAGSDVTLDAGAVAHLGALCLQAILVAATDAARAGRGFTVTGLPDDAAGQLSLYGLTPDTLSKGFAA